MFFNNNIAAANSGHSISENNAPNFNGHLLEATNGGPSTSATQASGFNLDATLDGLSTAEIEDWWLGPRPDGGAEQYTGSTLLHSPYDESARGYGLQTEPVPSTDNGEPHCNQLSIVNTTFNANSSPR